ncbi:MAG: hypothetical protein RLY78_3351 [Pseudomonadota bacterium]|jgi:DNA-binding transcriptional LysR family regulator
MSIELRHLRYFLAVAREGNVTRAAGRLGISQPPLSQQLKDLERQVGTELLLRTPQGVRLTAAGEVFRDEAERIVGATDAACAAALRAARGETGVLRLGYTASAAFNPVVAATIRQFRRQQPAVQLQLEELNTARLVDRLQQGLLDAAFARPDAQGFPGLDLLRLPDEPMRITLPVQHRLAQRTPSGGAPGDAPGDAPGEVAAIPLSALAGEDFVFFPRPVGLSLYDAVVQACRDAGFEPRIVQEAPQLATVVNFVAAELGVSIVPASMAQIAVAGVRHVAIAGPAPRATLALAGRSGDASPLLAHLRAACVQWLAQQADGGAAVS